MKFTSGNSSNYLAGAKEVNDITTNIYNTSRVTGVDVNNLIQTERKARATKLDSKNAAEGTIGKTAVNISAGIKKGDIERKSKKDVEKIMKPAKMAGALAQTVNVGNMGLMMHQDMKLDQKEAAERKTWREEQTKIRKEGEAARQEDNKKSNEFFKRYLEQNGYSMDTDGMPVLNPSVPSTSSNSSSTSVPITTSLSSVNSITPSGGNVDRQEVYTYLTKSKGLSKNKALGLMANIDRESTFRSNPAGGDGGNSFGMLQWNNTYGRSDLMKQNVPDYSTNWKGQLDHALSQNQLPEYNQFISKFKNTTYNSPQAASEAFLRNWERPADVVGGIAKNNQFIAGYNYQ